MTALLFTDPGLRRHVLRALSAFWRTARAWSNPMSIYGPDPAQLARLAFNDGFHERWNGIRRNLNEQTVAAALAVAADIQTEYDVALPDDIKADLIENVVYDAFLQLQEFRETLREEPDASA